MVWSHTQNIITKTMTVQWIIFAVSAARSMSEVKPEVLASGRVLVHSSEGPAAGVSQGGEGDKMP